MAETDEEKKKIYIYVIWGSDGHGGHFDRVSCGVRVEGKEENCESMATLIKC